jgi:hypothetical protein
MDAELSKLLSVGKQTVINYVSRRKEELCKKTYGTAMYGLHSMGYAQVDFGDVIVVRPNGAEEVWHELVVSFPWSNGGLAQICRYETKECLCEALQRIFEFIGCVPLRILFDNMHTWPPGPYSRSEYKRVECGRTYRGTRETPVDRNVYAIHNASPIQSGVL